MLRGLPSKTESQCLLVLVATVVVFLSPVLMTSKILWPGELLGSFSPWDELQAQVTPNNILLMDSVEQLYPYYQFHRSEVFQGRLPLWNPYVINGTPFLANAGWKAQVDQSEVEIFRADYLFRAVRVPAGKHVVRFHYRPTSFYWGMALSLLSMAVVAWMVFSSRRSRDKTERQSG